MQDQHSEQDQGAPSESPEDLGPDLDGKEAPNQGEPPRTATPSPGAVVGITIPRHPGDDADAGGGGE